MATEPKPATAVTVAANHAAVHRYEMGDRQDFEDADRGLIVGFNEPVLGPDGLIVFDPQSFDWIADDAGAPDSVEPSLWRQSQGHPPRWSVQADRRCLQGPQQRHRQPDGDRGVRGPGHHRLHVGCRAGRAGDYLRRRPRHLRPNFNIVTP